MGRRDEVRHSRGSGYIQTTSPLGYDVLINGTSKYLNFNTVSGESGFGIRDNAGTMEAKNSGGSWGAIVTSASGGITLANVSSVSTDATKSLYTMTSTIPVEFRSSDASTLLYLDETNKRIGIGTNAPSDSLSLSGNSATRIGTTWLNTNSSPATSAFLGAYSGNMQMGTVSNHPFYLETNNTVRISIAAAGNIGIGLNSGSAKLHVLATTEQLRLGYDVTNYASFTVGSTGILTIAPTGNQILFPAVSSGSAPAISFSGDTNTGIGWTSADILSLIAGGTNMLNVTTTGVGILTTTTSAPLHVVGAIRTQRSGIDTQYIETWGGDAGATYFSSYSTTGGQKILRFRNLVTGGAATDATNQFGWDLNTDSSILQIATLSFGSGFKVNRSNTTTQFLSVNGGDSSGIYLTGQSATSAEKILYISNFTNGTATSANGMRFRVGDVGTPVTAATIDYLGNVGIGVTPTHRLDAYLSSSSTGISSIYGLREIPSGTISSGSSINGVQGQLAVSGSTTISTITVTAGNFIAEHDGSSTIHALCGLRGWARTNAASTGVLASAKSILASAPANSQVGNTITNAYSLYIESPTAGTTLNYGLYQDGSANNYFGGSVGIGLTPTAKFHAQGAASGITGILQANATTPGNLLEFQSSAAAIQSFFTSNGRLMLNRATDAGAGTTLGVVGIATTNGIGMLFQPGQADARGLVVRAFSAQTADLLQIQKSSATVVSVINASGSFGIQQSSPTAYLHLGAGTATASTAPLKFTSGTLLTTPEAGVLEFSNDRLYLTNVNMRKIVDRSNDTIVATTTVANTVTETTIYTATIPANGLKVGNYIKNFVCGQLSSANGADTVTLNYYLGSTLLGTITTTAGVVTNEPWHSEVHITVRTTGVGGTFSVHIETDVSGALNHFNTPSTAVDTTAAQDLVVKAQWSNALAGNTLQINQGITEFKN